MLAVLALAGKNAGAHGKKSWRPRSLSWRSRAAPTAAPFRGPCSAEGGSAAPSGGLQRRRRRRGDLGSAAPAASAVASQQPPPGLLSLQAQGVWGLGPGWCFKDAGCWAQRHAPGEPAAQLQAAALHTGDAYAGAALDRHLAVMPTRPEAGLAATPGGSSRGATVPFPGPTSPCEQASLTAHSSGRPTSSPPCTTWSLLPVATSWRHSSKHCSSAGVAHGSGGIERRREACAAGTLLAAALAAGQPSEPSSPAARRMSSRGCSSLSLSCSPTAAQ